MKKGFTLIELLAVIIILAIIALIATPVVLKVVDNAKISAFKNTAYGLVDAGGFNYKESILKGTYNGIYTKFQGNVIVSPDTISVSGRLPDSGDMEVNSKGQVQLAIYDNVLGLCVYKKYNDAKVTAEKMEASNCNISSLCENDIDINLISTDANYSCFTFNDATKAITGYDFESCTLDVVIPTRINDVEVESIGSAAFGDFYNNLASIDFSHAKYLKNIEEEAFAYNNFTSVTIPYGVTSIGASAFAGNYNLTSITIPSSVVNISDNPFYGNSNLSSIVIDDNNKNYKSIDNAIYTIDGTTLITGTNNMSNNIENSVTSIGDYAFSSDQITSVTIPNSVTSIGSHAFDYNFLTSVTIPNSVTSIGSKAFQSNQLTSVTIPNSVTSIGSSAFDSNQLSSVTISNSVTSIEDYAFAWNKLTSVIIPNSVTSIGSYAFWNDQLTSVTIPNSVTSIGSYAFTDNKLVNVTLGNGLTTIGTKAFEKFSTYNPITTIYNNSGKSFDWTSITSSSTTGQLFVTGTITHQLGNITVTTN